MVEEINRWGLKVKYWEDFPLGEKIRTQGVTITEAHLVNWAALTGDWYPLHLDEEYAKTSLFKSRIAHGPLVMALAIGLVMRTGYFGTSIMAWLGVNNSRLPLPVRIGDTIHVETEIIDKKEMEKVERGVAIVRLTVRNQRDEEVIICDNAFMMHRRLKAS